ncbi:cytochrome P450 [Allokutzneria oryzae]|uniref:Cytochrome P450 n=1 Tax=Allokutzneria oryzae TaxID=1378989 RepID=A0ABV6A0Z4_9PSEU
MTGTTMETTAVNLADPRTFAEADLSGFWREVRTRRPVYWHEPHGFWVVSRHADILTVYRDNTRFTSERGNVLVTLLAGGDSAAGRMLAVTDGPRHRELRQILQKVFTPQALAQVARRVRQNTRRLVIDAVGRGDCDFATDIAGQIPITTVGDLLGVPDGDREFLLTQTKIALSSDEHDADELESSLARNEILAYFTDLAARRRQAPGDDVLSALVTSRVDGRPLSPDEVVLNCYSLVIGGDETSRLSMIEAVRALAEHPDQWDLLRRGEADLASAVEEVLRWASPTMHFGRTALVDVELGGQRFAAGDVVTLWHSSANRDETVFTAPDRFDLRRSPNKHIAFGHGPHFCLGAQLARIEIAEVLAALRAFSTGFEVTGPARRIHSNFLTGISSLPVRFTPDTAELY